jgi:hypothetical protein
MGKMVDHRTPASACLNCGREMDAAFAVQEDNHIPPTPGSVAICFDCSHIMVYDDDLKLREPSDKDIKDIAGDPDIIRAVEVIGAARAMWKGKKNEKERKSKAT